MHALAEELTGRVRFLIVEADRKGRVLEAFDAGSFPAYLVFRDGREVDRLTLNFTSLFLERRLRGMITGALD